MGSSYPIYEALEQRLLLSVSTQLVDQVDTASQVAVSTTADPSAALLVATSLPSVSVNLKKATLTSYGPSDGKSSIKNMAGTLFVTGNAWKKMKLAYNVTPYTVLEFDYKSSVKGDIQGLGFDTDNTPSWNRFIELRGTTPWGIDKYTDYDASNGQWKHYKVMLGDLFSGAMSYLTFVNAATSQTKADSSFRNIRIYDTATPAPGTARENIPLYALAQNGDIRAAFIAGDMYDTVPALAQAHVNTLFVKEGAWVDPTNAWVPGTIAAIQKWIQVGHQNGMNVLMGMNYWNQEDTNFNYQPWVDENGTVHSGNPCPNDELLWTYYMYTRISNVVQFHPDGILLDLEMYQTDPLVDYTSGCYCPNCLTSFAQSRGMTISGTMDQFRQQIVADSSLNAALMTFETQQIADRARYIRQNLVPADMVIAADRLDTSNSVHKTIPFYDGMAIGLGTPERPVLDFAEELYAGQWFGTPWHTYILQADKYLHSIGANVKQIFGVGLRDWTPQQLPNYLFSYAHSSAGTWAFTTTDFLPDRQQYLKGTPDQYLAAFNTAFSALEAYQTSSTYYSPLQLPLQ